MKTLNFTKEIAVIEFSLDELLIIKNSLLEVDKQITVNDFVAQVPKLSQDEAVQFAHLIGKIINCYPKSYKLTSADELIESVQSVDEGIILQIKYEALLGSRSILCALVHQMGVEISDFNLQIGFEKEQIHSLINSLNEDILGKMSKLRPEHFIFERSREIERELKLKPQYLSENCVQLEIKRTSEINFSTWKITFLLGSLENRKRWSIIQIRLSQMSAPFNYLSKSSFEYIAHERLASLIAYLELVISEVIEEEDLEKFTLITYHANYGLLFEIQVLSRWIKSPDEGNLKIRFRFYLNSQENTEDEQHIEIEDTATLKNVYAFISSVRSFLSELPTKINSG
ncbi:MAG: hypothetical protein F6K45_23945 [Kamptonema sp. SIO1D9]|nr:hypothetical protein [Kamptonema sp. SIO1D9]